MDKSDLCDLLYGSADCSIGLKKGYRGLSEWETEKGWLTDTCLDGQDTFKRLLAMFDL